MTDETTGLTRNRRRDQARDVRRTGCLHEAKDVYQSAIGDVRIQQRGGYALVEIGGGNVIEAMRRPAFLSWQRCTVVRAVSCTNDMRSLLGHRARVCGAGLLASCCVVTRVCRCGAATPARLTCTSCPTTAPLASTSRPTKRTRSLATSCRTQTTSQRRTRWATCSCCS